MNNKEAREIIKEFRDSGHIYYTPVDEDKLNIAIDLAIEALGNGWINLFDRIPKEEDADENGKVLIYRKMNDNQKPLEKSIHDWYMVKNCDPTETFWQPLPPKPKQP